MLRFSVSFHEIYSRICVKLSVITTARSRFDGFRREFIRSQGACHDMCSAASSLFHYQGQRGRRRLHQSYGLDLG